MRVLLLHDVSEGETRFGVRRRLHHLTVHEQAAGNSVEVRSVVPGARATPSRPERLFWGLRAARARAVAGYDKVVVEALAAPHMVLVARVLARSGTVPVQLDVCDSRRLMAAAQRRGTASELVARAAFARLPAALARSYISQTDADADADLSASATVVVGPAPLPELAALGPFTGRPESVLFPGDATHWEGRAALAQLCRVLADTGIDVPVEVSGEPPADAPPAAGAVRWLGRVPTLPELYDRPCVVVSTQAAGHGVQNKLWEAFQARRPIVAFDTALHWAPQLPWIHRVGSSAGLGPALRAALGTEHDTAVVSGPLPHARTGPPPAARRPWRDR